MDEEVRVSGAVEIDGEVVDGASSMNSSASGFLDDSSSACSSLSLSKKQCFGSVACKEMQRHLCLERERPVAQW